MGKNSVRKRVQAGIEQITQHIAAGNKAEALAVLARLRKLVKDGDPKGAARIRAVLDVHDARIAAMTQSERAKPEAVRVPSPNATCSLCRSPFHRDNDKETACDICRPPTRRSVRTVSGGAPGLGKRR